MHMQNSRLDFFAGLSCKISNNLLEIRTIT